MKGSVLRLSRRAANEGLEHETMLRLLRIEYPGAIYHVMNRGDRWEPISQDDFDRKRFVIKLN